MATTRRGSPRDLIGELRQSPGQFRFFQAVRLLALAEPAAEHSRTGLPANLRFRTPASLAFPASEITRLAPQTLPGRTFPGQPPDSIPDSDAPDGGAQPGHHAAESRPLLHMEVACLGLTGPSGVLPTPYTELLIERRVHHRDDGAHAFLDLFSHRSLALFYAAWRKYRFHIGHEQGEAHSFQLGLEAIAGVATSTAGPNTRCRPRSPGSAEDSDANSESLPPGIGSETFIHYAGLLARRPVSASALAGIVRGLFDVDARLQQFVGHWITIPAEEQTRLGSANAILGESACAGQRVWDAQSRCRLHLGPLTAAKFETFLPGRAGNLALAELLRFCFGHGLAIDLQLQLDRREVPAARLGSATGTDGAARLGQTLWLTRESPAHDPDDACFALIA